MKASSLYILLAILYAGSMKAQIISQETPQWPTEPWVSATPVELGRELPRTQTICYDSEAAAIEQNPEASAYFQLLAENWKNSTDGNVSLYEHTFKLPFAWIDRDLYLYIGSANAPYEVFVNGKRVGYNQSSWTPAEFNITKASKEGMNSLEIKVYGDAVASVLTDRAVDFSPKITGDVYILAQPRVRVRDYITRTHIEGSNAMIELGVILKSNLLNPRTLTVHYTLLAPDGETVTAGRRDREIDMRREDTVRFVVNIPNAKLWSPEDPNLYTLIVKTQNEGRYWEYIPYKVGIRSIETVVNELPIDKNASGIIERGNMRLNDHTFPLTVSENFTLNDCKLSGKDAAAANISEIKSRNINTITAAKPMPDWFYSLCDELGMFVITQADINTSQSGESRELGGNPANDPIWIDAYTDRAENMMYPAWHHPSVIGFSLGAGISNGYNLYESYLNAKNILNEAGDNRPVIYIDAGGEWNTDVITPEAASASPNVPAGRIITELPQPKSIIFEAQDPTNGVFSVTSDQYFRTIETTVSYTVYQGKRKVSSGEVGVTLMPATEATFTVPYGKAKPGKGSLNVELSISIPAQQKGAPAKTTTKIIEVAYL